MTAPIPLPPGLAALLGDARWTRDERGESGGAVFRIDRASGPALYLKHGAGEVAAAIVDEMARLRWLAGRAPVPDVEHFVCAGDSAWLLSSAMPGASMDAIVATDPTQAARLARLAGAFLRRLHDLPVEDCPFDAGATLRLAHARRRLDAGAVDAWDFGDDHDGWSAAQVWDEMTALLPIAFDRVVTHGDYSFGNLFVADGAVAGIIDVGRAGVADRYQDVAIMWENLAEFGVGAQAAFLAAYGVPAPDPRRLRFHRCLDEFF